MGNRSGSWFFSLRAQDKQLSVHRHSAKHFLDIIADLLYFHGGNFVHQPFSDVLENAIRISNAISGFNRLDGANEKRIDGGRKGMDPIVSLDTRRGRILDHRDPEIVKWPGPCR